MRVKFTPRAVTSNKSVNTQHKEVILCVGGTWGNDSEGKHNQRGFAEERVLSGSAQEHQGVGQRDRRIGAKQRD